MVSYEINIDNDLDGKLQKIAELSADSAEEILAKTIKNYLAQEIVEAVIQIYKDGKLKAREAWKLTGLGWDEFKQRVQ